MIYGTINTEKENRKKQKTRMNEMIKEEEVQRRI